MSEEIKTSHQSIVEATARLAKRSKIRMAIAVFLIRLATIVLGCDFEWDVNGAKVQE
jgi:hypothetical protein